jgi:hypothetical protein
MPAVGEIVGPLLLGLVVWVAGLHVFDLLHWALHGMLRSRWRLLRLLASPHAMHHRWLDGRLEIHWEGQAANFWGHIMLEYGTQIAFSAALLWLLPWRVVAAAVVYQTAVFAYIASQRGLDPNHRPVAVLDAYRPCFVALPAYHALHHVWPDAHYSAYTKLVDYLVAGGVQLRGRRIALAGGDSPFGAAMQAQLARAGVAALERLDVPAAEGLEARLAGTDVLVLCRPDLPRVALVEAFVRATRRRQLPPEVWAVQTDAADALGRHYYQDPRVIYRAIVAAPAALADVAGAGRAAAVAMSRVRRGFTFVPTAHAPAALRDFLAFRRTRPHAPDGVPARPRRAALAAAA